VGRGEPLAPIVRDDAHDQLFAEHAAAHVVFDHEGDAAEHRALARVRAANHEAANFLGELGVVGHGALPCHRQWGG
jgi:hypothetical protein